LNNFRRKAEPARPGPAGRNRQAARPQSRGDGAMVEKQPIFTFVSQAYPSDTFAVVSFEAEEALGELFRLEMLLASRDNAVDFADVIESAAHCVIHGKVQDLTLHGVVAEFEQLNQVDGYNFYHVVLVHKLWWLTLTTHNQVFLNQTVPQVLAKVLEDGGLTGQDYEFRLSQTYTPRELICQYNETHYHFFKRWLEREGLYYFFDRQDDRTLLVVTDTRQTHRDVHRHKELAYAPPSGLKPDDSELVVKFGCRQRITPRSVQVVDYNDQTPALDIRSAHQVAESGRGLSYHYGDHILTPSEGRRLALIQAEAHKAQALRYSGVSTLGALHNGLIFTLKGHFRPDFNRDYLVTRCKHRGNQATFLTAGLRQASEGLVEKGPAYVNLFEAIPADVQFRLKRTLEKPRIHGSLPAKIDAAGSGTYAELDDQGRYTVLLPFDLSGRRDGKASCRLRMIQPYAGAGHGMHFPLHKGAEVLLTFIDGDPDRPVIAGAVPNAESVSQVTDRNQTMSKIATAGGNVLSFEDLEGSERMLMQTPASGTWFRMGAPGVSTETEPPEEPGEGEPGDGEGNEGNEGDEGDEGNEGNEGDEGDEGDEDDEDEEDELNQHGMGEAEKGKNGFAYSTEGSWNATIGQYMDIKIGGNSTEIIIGGEETFVGGFYNHTVVGVKTEVTVGGTFEFLMALGVGMKLAGEIEMVTGFKLELDANLKTEMRPNTVETLENRLGLHNSNTEMRELDTKIHHLTTDLEDTLNLLIIVSNNLNKTMDKLSETERSMGEKETQLRTDINQVFSKVTHAYTRSLNYIVDHTQIGKQDFHQYVRSVAVTQKEFL
jgi:type VI secretion system secreted protein VgrG